LLRALCLLALALAPALQAQVLTSWNAGNGDWSTSINWNNGVPGAADTAIVANSGTAELTGAGAANFVKVGESGVGGLLISGGALTVASDSYIGNTGGTGAATVSSGSWSSGGSLVVGYNSGAGTLTIDGGTVSASTVYVAFAGTSTGTLNLNGGVLATGQIVDHGGGGTGAGQINFNGGILRATGNSLSFIPNFTTGNLQLGAGGAFIDTQAFTVTVANILQGAGGLTKQGAGTLNLLGFSTYTGGTTVSLGTLALAGRLADTGALTISGGTFSIGSVSDTVGAVTLDSGAITGTSGTLTGSSYSVHAGTVSAILGGSAALTKSTAGTVTLSGNNTYTGNTTVSAGTLQVNGRTAAGSAASVNSGATLGGTGTIAGGVVLNVGAIMAPGSGLGTLTTGNLTWNGSTDSSATMTFTLSNSGNTSSFLDIAGTLAKGSGSSFIFDFQGTGSFDHLDVNNPNIYTLANFSSSPGFSVNDFGYINLGSGLTGEFHLHVNDLQFGVVPEPSAWGLLAGGLAGLAVLWRKHGHWLGQQRPIQATTV
jgi:autotransporter-associated beta strand protein